MLLRKLEAYGFKSFAEKTEVEFKSGITAIVGPNGSGKSNISDAIRWVLGEQNIRNLRGAKSEDVIFAGSSKRRPLGVAEVSLIFDNSDGLLPLEFSEVIITRRIFRSGDGEYYINKSPCRLKDIHDLLTEAGLGRESLTVISQNKVDEVLNNKPEERRLLFEEAAGIMKYKHRKKEALRKLDDTEQNLTRVFDITSEIETQLGPLEESARRTLKYNELSAEETACQVTLLLDKLIHAEANQESVSLEQTATADEEISISTRLSVCETEKEKLIEGLAELDEALRGVEAAIAATVTDIERIDGKAAVLSERIGQEQRNKDRLSQEIARVTAESDDIKSTMSVKKSELTDRQQQVVSSQTELDAIQNDFQQVVGLIRQAEQEIELAKEQTLGHIQELTTQQNMLRTFERDLDLQRQDTVNLSAESEDCRHQLTEAEKLQQENKSAKTELEQQLIEIDAKIKNLTDQKRTIGQSTNEMVTEESKLSSQISEAVSRLKVLSNMQEEYEGFGRGPKSVLKSSAAWRKGVGGAVAQIISVPDLYVTAVETALGGALQHIIVDNDGVAKAAIEYLKNANQGRATFLPLNTVKPVRPRDSEVAAAHSDGALGLAAELVTCESRFRPIIDYLLGRTVVAKDIDAALKIAKQQSFSVKIVTLEGELLNPGGSIAGGSTGKRESSFLSRGNEIEVLKQTAKEQDDLRKSLRQRIADFQADIAGIEERLAGAVKKRRDFEVRQAELSVYAENCAADVKRLRLACATVETEIANCTRRGEQLIVKMADINQKIAALEERDTDHKRSINAQQDSLKEMLEIREKLNINLTDKKIQLSSLQQEVSALTANCDQFAQTESRLANHIETLAVDLARVEEEIIRANAALEGIVVDKNLLIDNKAQQEKERTIHTTEKLGIFAKQQKIDREIKDLRRKLNAVQGRIHELELLAAKFGYEINYATEQLRDHYQITREEAQALRREESPEILAARIAELETEIAALGTVNPAAIEEYAKLKERYEFLRTQYIDLTEAKNYLMTIIKDIDNTMSKQFLTAFQEINSHFGELFVRLFQGGKAQLELSTPDNILTSGIEITVQPPGKKQQNLALLSGGERALTVIGLLFAILTYRPTPFCVLDEIDAALDEANVGRFSDFLRDYSKNTQFIIVTHRRGTMEAADVMHGLTMEESGVSKLISVKFIEKTAV